MASPTPSLTNPNPKREGANQARHLTVNEPTEHAADAIYVHDEDDNDIATFFHSEHATVGQSYETALRLATLLVKANNGPSPADPIRAALVLIRDFAKSSVLVRNDALDCVHAVASRALSVSTPTGEGETRRHPWCQPGDDAKRRWLVYFEDTEKGFSVFEDETEAREFFDKANGGGWNCYLFAAAPRQSTALAHLQQGGERDGWKLVPVELSDETITAMTGVERNSMSWAAKAYATRYDHSRMLACVPIAPTSPSKGEAPELSYSPAPMPPNGIEGCIYCGQPFKEGDLVLNEYEGGLGHIGCFGAERESYVGRNGEPLRDDEPIPTGRPWVPTSPSKSSGEEA